MQTLIIEKLKSKIAFFLYFHEYGYWAILRKVR